ncbi:thioredoxin TrxC [Vibrio sp. TH_r3]|uniref:thioredoxin TrxC n=1 Tax=Vibrio sp. TH_r3 TaxID=3082084 RepID=UPI002954A775|nr:thioredoxin TrxC [Vibrio sp. TH_r3]MDV7103545.1 thioredoxin TrxC [Vibrio sp. TH_r3]
MTAFNTRCPSCNGLNRVPLQRVSEAATCGKCKSALFDGKPIEGTEANLAALLTSEQPVVIDFWAPWCNPCVGFAPVFQDVASERMGSMRFVKVDTEANQAIASQYRIRSIPTIMLFKNGKQIDMLNGAVAKTQFNQWLDTALNK